MTLPLIFALNKAGWNTKRHIINLIKNHSNKPEKVTEVIDFVKQSGGMEYATQVMQRYVDEAFDIMDAFPESKYKTSLRGLVQFTIDRKK